MAALEKAFLELETGDRIPCLFNPEKIVVGRRNNWDGGARPGRDVPRLRYTGAESGWMRLDLVFDTTAKGEAVTTHTGRILKLMDVESSLAGHDESWHNGRPQTVKFHWGDLHSFPAVVTDLGLTFTYFSSSGVPLRAEVRLELRQYEPSTAFGPQNPTSGTPKPHRTHRVQPGETLDRIAARYYGDATKWRRLAQANGIQDPLALRPGDLLNVPKADQ